MGLAGRDAVVGFVRRAAPVGIGRPFRVLVVEHAVGVHAVGPVRLVAKDYPDGVAHHSPQQRPQDPQMLPLRRPGLCGGERRIGVFPVHRLAVDSPEILRVRHHHKAVHRREGTARDPVGATGGIVPVDRLGGHVVGPRCAGTRGRGAPCQQTERERGGKSRASAGVGHGSIRRGGDQDNVGVTLPLSRVVRARPAQDRAPSRYTTAS